MTKQDRIQAFSELGKILASSTEEVQEVKDRAVANNSWFTTQHVDTAVRAIADWLTPSLLESWLAPYPFQDSIRKTVGLICAGNIPMVGFHDVLSVLIAGFKLQVKFSSDDQVLMRFVLEKLIQLDPRFARQIQMVERLQNFDLVIATGSDNTARYFHHYFDKYPNIIRQNRHGVALLNGSESSAELHELGKDIFTHFGLGCRNVSKLFVPAEYDVAHFYEGIQEYAGVMDHHKYRNNYDFNKSIYLINGDIHYDNGFLLLKPDTRLGSPLSVVYYESYTDAKDLAEKLNAAEAQIQCVVGSPSWRMQAPAFGQVLPFGQTQMPGLNDYADGVNTLAFLANYYS